MKACADEEWMCTHHAVLAEYAYAYAIAQEYTAIPWNDIRQAVESCDQRERQLASHPLNTVFATQCLIARTLL